MQYLKQFLVIIVFSLIGQILEKLIPLPIPAAIYGLVLLLVALLTGLVKLEKVKQAADSLVAAMPVLLVAPAVKVLEYWGMIAPNAIAILVIVVVTTAAVFALSGLITKWLMKGKGEQND